MAENALADAGFLVAILTDRDTNHRWACSISERHPPPWRTCEAVVSEVFHLLGPSGSLSFSQFLIRETIACAFRLDDNLEEVLALMRRYASVPMSFADACLVRMSETVPRAVLLTTDSDFRIYRRHSRQVVPCILPD